MRTVDEPLSLNGSHGEGGGALFRSAVVMSALTQLPLKLHSIRGATRKPGLTAEDLAFLEIVRQSTKAEIRGDDIGSLELTFAPKRPPKSVDVDLDITRFQAGKTPGNCLIVAQSVLPLLARTGAYSRIHLWGETHNPNTLVFDAFAKSTCAAHRAQGLYLFPSLSSAGFGYGGRGEFTMDIEPSALEPLAWGNRGDLLACGAEVSCVDMAPRFSSDAVSLSGQLLTKRGLQGEASFHELSGPEPGLSVTFWAQFERGTGSFTSVMPKGGRADRTIDHAWGQFEAFLDHTATVDPYLADQLLILACLASGKTTFTTPVVTRRLSTIAWVIKQFRPIHLTLKGREGTPGTLTIDP